MIDSLNKQFGSENITFFKGEGDLTFVKIANNSASAEICLHGAHVTSYIPKGGRPAIWVGDECIYKEGTAIRGGIPVCWPWFGAHPTDKTKPSHGFVRNRYWNVQTTFECDKSTTIVFSLTNDEISDKYWGYKFGVTLAVKVSDKLELELKTVNNDTREFTIGGALHSYFPVSNISDVSIIGLNDKPYIDALQNMNRFEQSGDIKFSGEVDRIYIDTPETCIIDDPNYSNNITIEKFGSCSTVVWNPWIEKSIGLSGFGSEEYKTMVCVETTNALEDIYTIAPGESHSLHATISLTGN